MTKKSKALDLNKVIGVLIEGVPLTAEGIAQAMNLDFRRKSNDRFLLSEALDELMAGGIVRQYGKKFVRPYETSTVDNDKTQTLVGVIQKTPEGSYFKSSNPEVEAIEMNCCNVADGTIVTIRPSDDFNAVARVLVEHGNLNDAAGLSLLSAVELGITVEFPKDVLEETIGMKVPVASANRKDMTHIPFVGIDPATAKDRDDIVCARKKGKNWVLMTAIADVSYYARPGSKLFEEAFKRGNTTYLPGLTIPMLPEALSNGLCSLTAGENRAAIVTTTEIDKNGNIVDHKQEKAIVRSRADLDYDTVQEAIDGFATGKAKELYNKYISKVEKVASLLEAESIERGYLNLSVSEQRIDYSPTTGVNISEERNSSSHDIISFSMVATNRTAVKELERLEKPILSRVHGEPNAKAYDSYKVEIEKLGGVPDETLGLADRVRDLAKQSFSLKSNGEKLRQILIRVQDRAKYDVGKSQHYGLGLKDGYTHFTSPIRRFNDLVVHSMTTAREGDSREFFIPENLKKVAAHITMTERLSDEAEKKAKQRITAAWLENNMGKIFNARVVNVDLDNNEIEVRGTKHGIHTYIPIKNTSEFKSGKIIQIMPLKADRITGVMRFKIAANDNGPSKMAALKMSVTKDTNVESETNGNTKHPWPRKREQRAFIPGRH